MAVTINIYPSCRKAGFNIYAIEVINNENEDVNVKAIVYNNDNVVYEKDFGYVQPNEARFFILDLGSYAYNKVVAIATTSTAEYTAEAIKSDTCNQCIVASMCGVSSTTVKPGDIITFDVSFSNELCNTIDSKVVVYDTYHNQLTTSDVITLNNGESTKLTLQVEIPNVAPETSAENVNYYIIALLLDVSSNVVHDVCYSGMYLVEERKPTTISVVVSWLHGTLGRNANTCSG